MSRRGSYIGGHTVVGPRWFQRNVDDMVQPRKARASKSGIRKRPTDFESAVVEYARAAAKAEAQGKPLPEVPEVIAQRYSGARLRAWKKMLKRTALYKKKRKAARKPPR